MTLTIVDDKIINPSVIFTSYPSKYNNLTVNELNDSGKTLCEIFSQTVAPITILADEGMFQKALPAFTFVEEDVLKLCWVSGTILDLTEEWLNENHLSVSSDVLDVFGKPSKVTVITDNVLKVSYAFVFKRENPLKGTGEGFTKAQKLATLDIGSYSLTSCKKIKITTAQGAVIEKTLVMVNGVEYWANNGLVQLLSIAALLPVELGTWKPLQLTLAVLSKGVTSQGHPFAKVALRNL